MGLSRNIFRIAIAQAMARDKSLIIGEAAFQIVAQERPDLATEIRGTYRDPSLAWKVDDRRFVAFVQFLEENW